MQQTLQVIPPEQPFATYVNGMVVYCLRMPLSALARQAELSFPGDPMVGQMIAGLRWQDMTQVQQFIWQYYTEGGLKLPPDLADILNAYRGPALAWNYSYTQWGLGLPA
jgi:hypothetical protein